MRSQVKAWSVSLSDGLFTVAMTLLALDLKVPANHANQTDQALLAAPGEFSPRFVVYLSFGSASNLAQSSGAQRPPFDLDST